MSELNVFMQRTITALLWLAGVYVFFRWLLVPLLPFLLALGLSAMLEPLVQRLSRRLGGRRRTAAAMVTTGVLGVLGGGLALLVLRLVLELRAWSERLPEAIAAFPALWNNALDQVERWYIASPPFLRSALDGLALQLTEEGPSLAGSVGNWLMGAASRLLAALPDAGLFLVTTVLAVYFTSLSYPAILAFLKRQLPPSWQSRCRAAVRCCRTAMLQWLRSELILIAVTFVLLLIGFFWMGLDFALLAATFTALVDALPVFGTGTVLLPWAVLALLGGDVRMSVGLLVLYSVISLVRSLLEPRLVGARVGLPPLAALVCMYVGFQALGVLGMLLAPLAAVLARQLWDSGLLHSLFGP